MSLKDLCYILENNYNLDIQNIEKVKNAYKVKTIENEYCLKVIKYEYAHFLFIVNAIKHLQGNGFNKIPEIIKTMNGEDYIQVDGNYAYLTKWIDARLCNYDNPLDLITAVTKLAELHKKSEGFEIMDNIKPRVGWFKWIETFKVRKNEILDFKGKIDSKEYISEFDNIYYNIMNEEIEKVNQSILHLEKSNYLSKMELEIKKKGFCHHDYAHHNILIEGDGSVNIIDFDYCILDTHLHDLCSILIRTMKNGKWDLEKALFMLNAYNKIYNIENDDIEIMSAFMEFPQEYWQIGIQYYWEKQPWEESFFIKKLQKFIEDKEEREEFINEFKKIKKSNIC